MSPPLENWLQEWGHWLDALLATGLACPTGETRLRIQAWCADAEALGFAAQCAAARVLLGGLPERADAFLGLLLEHDMLLRLSEAQHLTTYATCTDD
ncbi:MAG TPA: hypothetical protein VJA19_02865 [Pseudomonas sp.]|nr:hypothetical protein [Pseudomonas sp.]